MNVFKIGPHRSGVRSTIILVKSLLLGLALLPLFATGPAKAQRLSSEVCTHLAAEYKRLKSDPAVKNMAKGHEWVKANMEEAARLPIKHYIEIEEKLRFQCRSRGKKSPVAKFKQVKKPKGLSRKNLPKKKPAQTAKKPKPTTKPPIKKQPKPKKVKKSSTKLKKDTQETNLIEDLLTTLAPSEN